MPWPRAFHEQTVRREDTQEPRSPSPLTHPGPRALRNMRNRDTSSFRSSRVPSHALTHSQHHCRSTGCRVCRVNVHTNTFAQSRTREDLHASPIPVGPHPAPSTVHRPTTDRSATPLASLSTVPESTRRIRACSVRSAAASQQRAAPAPRLAGRTAAARSPRRPPRRQRSRRRRPGHSRGATQTAMASASQEQRCRSSASPRPP